MKLSDATAAVFLVLLVPSVAVHATSLSISGTSTNGVSFLETYNGLDNSVSEFFSGAASTTPVTVVALAFDPIANAGATSSLLAENSLNNALPGLVAGVGRQLSISGDVMGEPNEVVSVVVSGVSSSFRLDAAVEATPIPTAGWLFISAVLGLFIVRGRRERFLEAA